jgi:ribosomal protein S18 acetylase RimI-like enzyme
MNSGLIIRQIGPEDVKKLVTFFIENNRREITQHFHPFQLTEDQALRLVYHPGKDRYYLALAGDVIVGFGMLRGWNEGFEIPSFGMFVGHDHQGTGVGRKLAVEILEDAKTLANTVRLTVNTDNFPAIGLYRSLNFRVMSTESTPTGGQSFTMFKNFHEK